MQIFTNAKLVLEDGLIENAFLIAKEGKILEFGQMDAFPHRLSNIFDCKGMYLAPGFIDLHTHGAGGHDFMDGTVEAMVGASLAHMMHGTTSIMPTTLTSSDADLFRAIDSYHTVCNMDIALPRFLGLHLEGPYFAESQKGAQPESYIRNPDKEHVLKILDYAKGAVSRWSLAPELPFANEVIQLLAEKGILVSAAHTDATFHEMQTAYASGVRLLTHFYSAMSSIKRVDGHRVLGAVEAGYMLDGLSLELIADGVHLPKELLQMIVRFKNHAEIILCTDSMRGASMPNGQYLLGSKQDGDMVLVEDGIAILPDRSAFAGSVATADRLIKVMIEQAGLPIYTAVKMLTANPARLIGKDHEIGTISIGKCADFVLLNEEIEVQAVYVSGIKMFEQGK